MLVEAPIDTSGGVRPLPLRRNFAWTFAGNAIFGVSQWAILSLIAKLGDAYMLGQYALAFAIATPAGMFSHLNLRSVLATDVEARQPFGDYVALRVWATAVTVLATAGFAVAAGYKGSLAVAIVLAAASVSADNLSDMYYGAMQRRERMDRVARSMIARGILSVAAVAIALRLTHNLVIAMAALVGARLAVWAAYERPLGSAGEDRSRSGRRAQLLLLRTALPLGVVLMLVSLNTNMPRYAIERYLGTRELGAFSAIASFVAIGSTIVNALGQSATPRLARYFHSPDLRAFRGLALRVIALGLAVGCAGVGVSLAAGRLVLRLLYRPEYEPYAGLLTAVMGAAVLIYVSIALGYVITSARAFAPQMPLLCVVAAACAIASWVLVPHVGLYGGAAALAIAACVQIAGQLAILQRATAAARRPQ